MPPQTHYTDDPMQHIDPYVMLRNPDTSEVKRFSNTSAANCFDILAARKSGWIYDEGLSADREDDSDG